MAPRDNQSDSYQKPGYGSVPSIDNSDDGVEQNASRNSFGRVLQNKWVMVAVVGVVALTSGFFVGNHRDVVSRWSEMSGRYEPNSFNQGKTSGAWDDEENEPDSVEDIEARLKAASLSKWYRRNPVTLRCVAADANFFFLLLLKLSS